MTAQLIFLFDWFMENPLVAVLTVIVLLLMLWQQPRQTIKFFVAVAVLVMLGYVAEGLVNFTLYGAFLKHSMVSVPVE